MLGIPGTSAEKHVTLHRLFSIVADGWAGPYSTSVSLGENRGGQIGDQNIAAGWPATARACSWREHHVDPRVFHLPTTDDFQLFADAPPRDPCTVTRAPLNIQPFPAVLGWSLGAVGLHRGQ